MKTFVSRGLGVDVWSVRVEETEVLTQYVRLPNLFHKTA
jgi:hypothetical protein